LATVVVTATAARNLRSLIESHSLPASTVERVQASLEPLRDFPSLGAPLGGRWTGYRFVLGPWRWMLIVYRFDERADRVQVMTIRDARSERSPTLRRG
jgi:plasmid stabilization system protein ParE